MSEHSNVVELTDEELMSQQLAVLCRISSCPAHLLSRFVIVCTVAQGAVAGIHPHHVEALALINHLDEFSQRIIDGAPTGMLQ